MIDEQLAFEKLSRIRKQVESKAYDRKIKTAIVSDAEEQEKAENERRILRQKLATLEKRVALEAEKPHYNPVPEYFNLEIMISLKTVRGK